MAAEVRPTVRSRPRGAGESRVRKRQWWHYAIVVTAVLVVGGMVWGGYAIWFSMTHVRATYARISGYVVNVSAKGDTRVREILVKTGDQVHVGQELVALDSADQQAEVEKMQAQLAAQKSALMRAEADLDMTIRQTSASEQQAAAEVAASQARLAQAQTEMQMQARQQPDTMRDAEARLEVAQANLRRLKAGARPQEIEQAKADVNAAQAQLENATSYLARMQKLNQQGAVSAQSLEEASTNKRVTEAALRSAQEKLSLLQAGNRQEDIERATQEVEAARAAVALAQTKALEGQMMSSAVATRKAERQQADATLFAAQSTRRSIALKEQDVLAQRSAVTSAEAALQQAQVRLSESSLRSPVDGIVVRGSGGSVHAGEVVTKGMAIVTIVSTKNPTNPKGNPFWISSSVSELYAARVQEGQPAIIQIEAFPHRKFRGKVEQVGGATEFSGGASGDSSSSSPWMLQQVPVRVSFEREEAPVKPGMSAQVWFDIRKK